MSPSNQVPPNSQNVGPSRRAVLVILDGFGINASSRSNAIAQAQTPILTALLEKYPHGQLEASESFVGLPKGFMGNSEVGHLNIGAGRVVYQDFSLISHAIEEGKFFENPAFLHLFKKMKEARGKRPTLHLMGLVSDGGVHSHISHLYALIQLAKKNGIERVAIHAITDGRDTSPTSGVEYLSKVQSFLNDIGLGEIATISGRFYAMDRDNRWERVHQAYRAFVGGQSEKKYTDPMRYVSESYASNVTDEFLLPAVAKDYSGMADGDGVIFFNFRADRAREISRAITQPEFDGFVREELPTLAGFVCMTPYDASLSLPTAYEKPKIPKTLGEIVSARGWKQLRIAETEKYAHVTYFFNGGEEKVFPGEKRVLVPSPREVTTYDQKPEMSARQVTDTLIKELDEGNYALAVVNFANPDMVGHTGNLRAAVKAVEVVDECLGKIVAWIEAHDAFAIITADHGNCERMEDEKGTPFTSHTTLPVPFLVIDPNHLDAKVASGGRLCDIAPTLLSLWGVAAPAEMTGRNLVVPLN